METFKDYAYYYNAFYKDKDYKSEVEAVVKIIKKYAPNAGKIMDYGCGTGRHSIELSRMGYKCRGIDISAEMIEVAKRNSADDNCNIDFQVADVRSYIAEEKCDAVVSLFHVMSYQNSNGDIFSAFKSARTNLDRNGIFIFDAWYGPGVLSDKPCVRVYEAEDGENKLVRIARPVMHDKENVVDVNYEVLIINKDTNNTKVITETHSMRYFFRPELELLLKQAEFELIDNIDCRTLGESDYCSWTSYFIAKAV